MKKSGVLVIVLIGLLTVFVTPSARAEGATIWTDKASYGPEETVTIFGRAFLATLQVTVTIEAPDLTADTIYVLTDDSGAFTAQYTLDGMEGEYIVTATDGTNTAITTFIEPLVIQWYFTATISPTAAYTLETNTYTITITNDVSSIYRIRSASVAVPIGFTSISIISVSAPPGKTWTAALVPGEIRLAQAYWDLRLEPGESVSVTFSATAPATQGTYEWTARAYMQFNWAGFEFIILGDQPKVDVALASPPEADVGIQKTADNYAHEGDTITYQFTVTNYGPSAAINVHVSDNMLGDLTGYLPDTTLDIDETNTFSINYVVPSPSGNIINTVTVTSNAFDPNSANNQATWTVTVVPRSLVTDSTLRYFDVNGTRFSQQFRLIFTQDGTNTFALKASNPGQFYYNVFYIGTAGDTITLDIRIPYPFVTQGSEPIHLYSLVTTSSGCFVPSDDLFGFTITGTSTTTPSGALGISLTDYSPQAFGSFVTIRITGNVPSSTLVYVTVHLDYGLKGTSGYGKNINNDAINPITSMIKIPNLGPYIFSVGGGMSDSQIIQNENIFKRDPGIAGLVLDVDGTPLQGVKVNIYNSKGKLLVTLYTDQDGWYQWLYKYTGKPTTFQVKVPKYNLETTVLFKANGFIEIDFQLPNTITVHSKWN